MVTTKQSQLLPMEEQQNKELHCFLSDEKILNLWHITSFSLLLHQPPSLNICLQDLGTGRSNGSVPHHKKQNNPYSLTWGLHYPQKTQKLSECDWYITLKCESPATLSSPRQEGSYPRIKIRRSLLSFPQHTSSSMFTQPTTTLYTPTHGSVVVQTMLLDHVTGDYHHSDSVWL